MVYTVIQWRLANAPAWLSILLERLQSGERRDTWPARASVRGFSCPARTAVLPRPTRPHTCIDPWPSPPRLSRAADQACSRTVVDPAPVPRTAHEHPRGLGPTGGHTAPVLSYPPSGEQQ